MKRINIEYYTVKMLYDENSLNKLQNFNSFWEACEVYHNWCDSHTFMVVMVKNVISNNAINEYPMAVYNPEKDEEDRESVFF